MSMYAEYRDAPTLAGSWPILPDAHVLSGALVIPRTLRSQATILGVRRETDTGFTVSGQAFYLDVDAYTNIPVAFTGSDPLTLNDVISQINGAVSPTTGFDVAFRDNGFLRLKSDTTGVDSYLAIHTNNSYGPAVLTALGLFAEIESHGGELEQTPTIDAGRQVAYPGQMLMAEGEDLDTRSYNRLMLQIALNSDLQQGILNRKRLAKTKEGSVTDPADGFILSDEVYVGMSATPTVEELENLIVVLDSSGTEPVIEVEGTPRYTGSMTFSTDPVTGDLLCYAAGQFLSSDEKDPVYVICDDAGMGTLQGKALKVVQYRSADQVAVNNRDDDGTPVNPSGSWTGRISEVTREGVRVNAFRDAPAGSRVEAVQSTVSSGAINRIEKNNRLITTDGGVDFEAQVLEGDLVTITGHTPGDPISNNGTYRVFRIIDQKTIELVGEDYGPAFLTNVGTSLGNFVVKTNGNFYYHPYVELTHALPTGTYRLVYMVPSAFSGFMDNLAAFAIPPMRYQQEADDSVGEALRRIMGPSVNHYTEVIYGDYRLNLEDLDFRLDNEHDDTGRHTGVKKLIVNHVTNQSTPTLSDHAVDFDATHTGSGTLTNQIVVKVDRYGTGAHGAITKSYGIVVGQPSFSGSCGSSYGLYFDSQVGATNNYAIYTNDGQNRFGDWVGIGSPTSRASAGELFRVQGDLLPGEWLSFIGGQLNSVSASAVETLRIYTTPAHTGSYTGTIYGLRSTFLPASSSATTSDVRLLSADAGVGTAGISNLYLAHLTVASSSPGNSCTNLYGAYIDTTGPNVTANSKYGVCIGSMGGGTNQYGLFVNNVSGGTENYSIFTNAGVAHFGGNVAVYTTLPQHAIHTVGDIAVARHENDPGTNSFVSRRSRGTEASPAGLENGDYFARFRGVGYAPTLGWTTSAEILFGTTETWTSSAVGSFVSVRAAKPGTTSLIDRVTISSNLMLAFEDGSVSTYSSDHYQHRSDVTYGPFYHLRRTTGSWASPGNVASGTELGVLSFQGYYGGSYYSGAWIRGAVDGTPGASDMPGRLEFLVSPDGSATPAVAMTIKSTGYVGIGFNAPAASLHVSSGSTRQLTVGSGSAVWGDFSSCPGGYSAVGSNLYFNGADNTLRAAQAISGGYVAGMLTNWSGIGGITFVNYTSAVTANQNISGSVIRLLDLNASVSSFRSNSIYVGASPSGNCYLDLGYSPAFSTFSRDVYLNFHGLSDGAANAFIVRYGGANGAFTVTQSGSGTFTIDHGGTGTIEIRGNSTATVPVSIFRASTQLVTFGGPSYTCDVLGSLHYTSSAASSDERFKANVETLTGCLDKVKALRGVAFNWNALHRQMSNSNYEREYGFIAQEAELVVPELIKRWKRDPYETEWLAINYERMIPVLVEAIKELEARVAALEPA